MWQREWKVKNRYCIFNCIIDFLIIENLFSALAQLRYRHNHETEKIQVIAAFNESDHVVESTHSDQLIVVKQPDKRFWHIDNTLPAQDTELGNFFDLTGFVYGVPDYTRHWREQCFSADTFTDLEVILILEKKPSIVTNLRPHVSNKSRFIRWISWSRF